MSLRGHNTIFANFKRYGHKSQYPCNSPPTFQNNNANPSTTLEDLQVDQKENQKKDTTSINGWKDSSPYPQPKISSTGLKDYTKDQHLATKPPLPIPAVSSSTSMVHRPPSRLSSRNHWATKAGMCSSSSTTSSGGGNNNSRPVSPITRSGQGFHPCSSGHKELSVQYKGPPLTYLGPQNKICFGNKASNLAEGPDNLQWSSLELEEDDTNTQSSTSREFQNSVCEAISGFPIGAPPTTKLASCREVYSEHAPPRSMADKHQCPAVQHLQNGNCLLNTNIPLKSSQPSTDLHGRRQKAATLTADVLLKEINSAIQSHSSNHHGPFSSTGVPNEIQDDLLRIEMLLELRKYKQALSTQIEAQQRMIQMCSSGCVPPPSLLQQHPQQQSESTQQSSPQNFQVSSETHQQILNWLTNEKRNELYKLNMDSPSQPYKIYRDEQQEGESSTGRHPPHHPQDDGKKMIAVWGNEEEEREDLGRNKSVGSLPPDFNSFMEPHAIGGSTGARVQPSIAPSPLAGGGVHSRTAAELTTPHLNNLSFNELMLELEKQSRSPRSVSLLKGAVGAEEFQAKSGFPSGLISGLGHQQRDPRLQQSFISQPKSLPIQQQQQNTLLAGVGTQNSLPNYSQVSPVGVEDYAEKVFQQLEQARFQQTLQDTPSSQPYTSMQTMPPASQAPDPQQVLSFQQQQYQQYLKDKNQFLEKLHSFTPNAFKLASTTATSSRLSTQLGEQLQRELRQQESHNVGQMIMLRKPVAVSKSRSPNSQSPSIATPSPPLSTSTTISGEDRPSPFFPGLNGSGIDIKIKSPEDRLREIGKLDVEELGNLLSQLPVLSRKQKVEEFKKDLDDFPFNILKPPSPATEAESVTSMLPLASSNGTLTSRGIAERMLSSGEDRSTTRESSRHRSRNRSSSRRNDRTDMEELQVSREEESDMATLDTDKMSLHELVSLGRKIYRILSHLHPLKHPPPSLIPKEHQKHTTAIAPPATVPSAAIKGQSKSATTSAILDFNSIPNPTFVTGPGVGVVVSRGSAQSSRSTPRVVDGSTPSFSTNNQPPNLFKKVLQPPPTRWDKRSDSMSSYQQQQKLSREQSRRSMSSVGARPTRTVFQWETNPEAASNNNVTKKMKNSSSYTIKSYNNVVNNNVEILPAAVSSKPSSKYVRQDTPYPIQMIPPSSFLVEPPSFDPVLASTSRSESKTRRNFIKENISRVREMKKKKQRSSGAVQLPPLPLVGRRYDNVQSMIGFKQPRSGGVRDRSTSGTRTGGYQRSNSFPPLQTTSRGQRGKLIVNDKFQHAGNSRPSSVRSVSSRSPGQASRSKSRESVRSTATINKPATKGGGVKGKPQDRMSRTQSKSSVINQPKPQQQPMTVRKSRSKTRKSSAMITAVAQKYGGGKDASTKTPVSRQSSNSDVTITKKAKSKTGDGNKKAAGGDGGTGGGEVIPKNISEQTVTKKNVKKVSSSKSTRSSLKKSLKHGSNAEVMMGEVVVDTGSGEMPPNLDAYLATTESEQQIIRELVKAEMDMMVKKHVKDVLKNSPLPESGGSGGYQEENRRRRLPKTHDGMESSDLDDSPMDSGILTPVYSPPRFYDESLFSLEKWINPEVSTAPGSPYTSAKETPVTTAEPQRQFRETQRKASGGIKKQSIMKAQSKSQTVRFSLPQKKK